MKDFKLKKIFTLIAVVFILMIFVFQSSSAFQIHKAEIHQGILELSEEDLNHQTIISLEGDWQFFWFPDPDTNQKDYYSKRPESYLFLPGLWNHQKDTNYPAEGYGLYRLRIRYNGKPKRFAVLCGAPSTSCEMKVNGRTLMNSGIPYFDPAWYRPSYNRPLKSFDSSNELVMDLYVANYDYRGGGMWHSLYFGEEETLESFHNLLIILQMMLFGAMLFLMLYHLILSLYHPEKKGSLFLSMTVFGFLLRILFTDNYLISYFFPNFPWMFIPHIEYLSYIMVLLFWYLYTYSVFPLKLFKYERIFVLIMSVIEILMIVLLPIKVSSQLIYLLHAFAFIVFILIMTRLIKSYLQKISGIMVYITGTVILVLMISIDIFRLILFEYQPVIYMMNIGVFVFAMFQSALLAKRFSDAYYEKENLYRQLQDSALKAREQDRMIMQQSKQAVLGEMMGSISHQWKQPLTALSVLVQKLRYYRENGEDSEKLLMNGMDKINQIIGFLFQTMDHFKNIYNPEKERNHFQVIDVVNDVYRLMNDDLINFKIHLYITCYSSFELYGFKNDLSQILLILISNARDILKDQELPEGRRITIEIGKDEQRMISVNDNGGGIPDHIKERIFDNFFTTKNDGSGIGLYLALSIIEKHLNGHIRAYNNEDGASFVMNFN